MMMSVILSKCIQVNIIKCAPSNVQTETSVLHYNNHVADYILILSDFPKSV